MARNRKRAKERRARRPPGTPIATTVRRDRDAAPDPIEHAAPDAELAEAQLAVGRPEFVDEEPEIDDEALDAEALGGGAGDVGDGGTIGGDRDGDGDGAGLPAASGSAPVPARAKPGSRLITFLQGSWRELQRVQWPDRRQVMQATGVVIGFVIVAGIFLGVADTVAAKLMDYILK